MAFQGMFGAGVNGLFSGMSDAMKLYSMYQGIQQTQAGIDNADKVRQAMQDDLDKQQPAGSAKDNIWGGGVNPNDTNDPGSNIDKPDPDVGVAKPSEGVKTLAGADRPAKTDADLDKVGPSAGTTPETKTDTGAALTPNAPIVSPAAGAAAASGLQTPPRTGPVAASTNPPEGTPGTQGIPEQQSPPASAKETHDQQRWKAWLKAGGTVADWLASGGSPSAVAGHGVSAGADPTGGAASAPITPPVPTPAPAAAAPGAIGTPTTSPQQPPVQAGDPSLMGAPAGPALTPAPYPGRPVQGPPVPQPQRSLGNRALDQVDPVTPVPGSPLTQPPAPSFAPSVTPPQAPVPSTQQGVGGATPYPGRPEQGPPIPQPARSPGNRAFDQLDPVTPIPSNPPQRTSDASPSIGSRILSAFNPMGSAQAAEPTPGQGQGPGQGQSQPSSTPAATDTSAQPQGAIGGQPPTVQAKPAPATSSAAQQPAQQQTGPAKTNAPVAPNQQGQTATSEAPPKVQTPEFDHRPFALLRHDHPEDFDLLSKIAGEENANPAWVARVWMNESGMRHTAPVGADGEVGPLQILPSTQRIVDPQMREDVSTLPGALRIAARLGHLVIDPQFPLGSPSSFLAYNKGNGAADLASKMPWDEFAKIHPVGAEYVRKAMGGATLAQGMFTPATQVDMKQFVDAGIQQGPNGALEVLARTGPAGMSMSNLWKQAEISGVYAALMRGDQQGAMAARDFVFQMSHAGATSNLMAADKALLSGDGEATAQYLAKAHAFFPDGTYGQFGVDKSGQVWGQRFDEATGKPLAAPFQVTHEGLATQLIETRDPNKYRELVNKEQQNAADLRLKAAHESYYYNQPDARTQAAALRANTQLQIEGQRETARQTQNEENNRVKLQIAAGRADSTAKHEQGVEKEAHDLYTPDSNGTYRGLTDMQAADAAPVAGHIGEIYTAVRNSEQPNGGHLSSPFAQTLAKTIAQGGQIGFERKTNPTTGESVVEMSDKAGNKVGYLSPAQAQRLLGLGLIKVPQSQAPQAPGQGAGQRAAIGGGAGSYQVAASGGGTNLANQPYQMPQPAQAIG